MVTATYGGLTDKVDITVLDIIKFLIRDGANHWNLIKHTPPDGRYRDHEQEVWEDRRQVIVAAKGMLRRNFATVSLEIVTNPPGLEHKIIWRAPSPQVNPQTGAFGTSGKASVTIRSAGREQETYQIYVGLDSNRDGVLDDKEVRSVNTVRLLTRFHLWWNYGVAISGTRLLDALGLNVAPTHAYIFLGQPWLARIRSRRIEQIKIPRTREALHHPVGAHFSSDRGIATIDRRVFDADSETANKIEGSRALMEEIKKDLAILKERDILPYFAQPRSRNTKDFKFTRELSLIDFREYEFVEPDLALGIGGATVKYHLSVRVNRDRRTRQLSIAHVNLTEGKLTDLYDWNFYDGGFFEMFATIQFAWGSPPFPGAGRIFRVCVNFNRMFRRFPFSLN